MLDSTVSVDWATAYFSAALAGRARGAQGEDEDQEGHDGRADQDRHKDIDDDARLPTPR